MFLFFNIKSLDYLEEGYRTTRYESYQLYVFFKYDRYKSKMPDAYKASGIVYMFSYIIISYMILTILSIG